MKTIMPAAAIIGAVLVPLRVSADDLRPCSSFSVMSAEDQTTTVRNVLNSMSSDKSEDLRESARRLGEQGVSKEMSDRITAVRVADECHHSPDLTVEYVMSHLR
jgi:hypothetical protein